MVCLKHAWKQMGWIPSRAARCPHERQVYQEAEGGAGAPASTHCNHPKQALPLNDPSLVCKTPPPPLAFGRQTAKTPKAARPQQRCVASPRAISASEGRIALVSVLIGCCKCRGPSRPLCGDRPCGGWGGWPSRDPPRGCKRNGERGGVCWKSLASLMIADSFYSLCVFCSGL